jgi:adenine deaminase
MPLPTREDIAPELERRRRLLAVARGDAEPDLVITGGRVFCAPTREWLDGDVGIVDGQIAGVGRFDGGERVEADGRPVVPGFVDAHVHIESSKLTPAEFARMVVPRGTTSVVVDPHEIANVLGLPGVAWFVESAQGLPLDVLAMAPSCVPASPLESPKGDLSPEDVAALARSAGMLGVAEMMNFPAVVAGDADELRKLLLAGRPADGHAPGLGGRALDAYVAAGIGTDHEATTWEEALDKRRRGLWVLLREASNARNLRDLLPLVLEHGPDWCAFCTDDREPTTLRDGGHLDELCRIAREGGVAAEDVLLLASTNPARCHGLHDRGMIAPGRRADVLVLEDLEAFRPAVVVAGGRVVARAGVAAPFTVPAAPAWVRESFAAAPLAAAQLALPAPPDGAPIRVIGLVAGQLLTESLTERPTVAAKVPDGRERMGIDPCDAHPHSTSDDAELVVVADPARDLVKLAVVERHHATGRVGLGLVRGFGLQRGAFASTVAHDAHNLVIAGVDDDDMAACAARLAELGGGLCVVEGGVVVAELPLPVAGLLSERDGHTVAAQLDAVDAALAARGVRLPEPMMALSFLALSVIPELKLTDRGLVDVVRGALVGLAA